MEEKKQRALHKNNGAETDEGQQKPKAVKVLKRISLKEPSKPTTGFKNNVFML